MPGQSDYGTLDRRHQAERETAVYAVLASINIKRHRKTMSHEKTKRKTILNLQLHLWTSTSFVLSPLKSQRIWSTFSMRWPRRFCHFHFSSLCAPHVVSPRDLWLCVLPRWQFNVNVNHGELLILTCLGALVFICSLEELLSMRTVLMAATLLLAVHASSPSLRVPRMPTSSVRRSNVLACAASSKVAAISMVRIKDGL